MPRTRVVQHGLPELVPPQSHRRSLSRSPRHLSGTNADWLRQAFVRAPISSSPHPRLDGKAISVPKHPATVKRRTSVPLPVWAKIPAATSALVGLLLDFALSTRAIDCGTEDITKTGAGIGGAKLSHRPLFLIHFTGLDRQCDLAGRAVDGRHLGINFLADSETIRPLFATIAG